MGLGGDLPSGGECRLGGAWNQGGAGVSSWVSGGGGGRPKDIGVGAGGVAGIMRRGARMASEPARARRPAFMSTMRHDRSHRPGRPPAAGGMARVRCRSSCRRRTRRRACRSSWMRSRGRSAWWGEGGRVRIGWSGSRWSSSMMGRRMSRSGAAAAGRGVPGAAADRAGRNAGQSGATPAGFRGARGEWVAMLDADLQRPGLELAQLWDNALQDVAGVRPRGAGGELADARPAIAHR